jgi:hypothetical protein
MVPPLNRHIISFVQKAYSYDPHQRIDSVGGINSDQTRWKLSQDATIAAIESGRSEFFVTAHHHSIRVVVVTYAGKKYLKTEHDEKGPDTLLALPPS